MTDPWAQEFEQLSTQARAVLATVIHLRLTTVSSAGIQALRGPSPDAPNAVLNELSGSGWLTQSGGHGWVVPAAARSWLVAYPDLTGARMADAALERFVAYLQDSVTARRAELDAVRGAEIVAAVRARARTRPQDAVDFARETWCALSSPPPTQHQPWWQDLADGGEAAAIDARLPGGLIDLLWESGNALANAGELFKADLQWRRAFMVAERAGDRERSADMLLVVGRQYRATRWFDKALTAFHELVSLRKEADDELGCGEALTELAVTLIDVDRGSDARHFLDRAGSILAMPASPIDSPADSPIDGPVDGPTPALTRQTTALVSLARAWDRLGETRKAVMFYGQALAALIDVDDVAAAEVRVAFAAVAAKRDAR